MAAGLCAALALAAGCGFDGAGAADGNGDDVSDGDDGDGEDDGDDDGGIGGQPDAAPPDAPPDVCLSWNPGIPFDPCDIEVAARGGSLVLDQPGTYNYNTNDGSLTPPGGGTPIEHEFQEVTIGGATVHLVSAQSFRIETGAILRAAGDNPLLIISWTDTAIEGEIDVSSAGASRGTDSNSSDCGDSSTGGTGGTDPEGGSGGGGGGFGGAGGLGGFGDGVVENAGVAGAAASDPIGLRGGCAGGDGGVTVAPDPGASGGAGGGAVALSAYTSILITGTIHAGGSGGDGGDDDSLAGGGGGGSGGMIWVDAPEIDVGDAAVLAAEGGGGGEGSDGNPAQATGDGLPGRTDSNAALGGSGGGSGGDGGSGSGGGEGLTGDVGEERQDGAGGGGGGGSGIIRASGDFDAAPGALITPTATN
jgi:hypothetical protein